MFPWHTALLLSLFTGAVIGTDELSLDALAATFADNPTVLAAGIDARVAQLDHGAVDARVARQTMSLVAPLAERVGLATERARLEDASFRLLDPSTYEALSRSIGRTAEQDAAQVAQLITETEALLRGAGIEGHVTARVKSVYSTWRKLERKELALAELTDRIALRVHVQSEDQCYAVRDLLERRWSTLPGERDDYIANPKANGYRSLHSALQTGGGWHDIAEFQVRTHEMHAAAEHGDAAHWRYKAEA